MKVLLPVTYFGNIEFFSLMFQADDIRFELYEHFVKQTYRNRCEIYGANGKLDLIVPIRHGRKERTILHQCEIDYSSRWQMLHWRSIESGYRRSPYFEYYEDRLRPIFEEKYETLSALNEVTIKLIISLAKTEIKYQFTSAYEKNPTDYTDYRMKLDPKKREQFVHEKYAQVFENRFGFISNLSILDLLFNLGPQGFSMLKK